jgi:NADH dehydrogenase [ubiquinone] 1 alpha subcomplex assembly factor 3
MPSGFQLSNGARISDGSGVLLIGGEAFRWRPWQARPSSEPFRLLNKKGQWDVAPDTLNLLAPLWPRPDLWGLGLGPENRPISPEVRKAISDMGLRVEVLDTRNAAAQFNLLARERGVDDVAAALVPLGWQEGVGAGRDDDGDVTHEWDLNPRSTAAAAVEKTGDKIGNYDGIGAKIYMPETLK